MLYYFLYPIHYTYRIFWVFRYISFRVLMSVLTALLISFVIGPWLIRWLKSRQIGQPVRSDGPKRHLEKSGTPTMGGILIIAAMIASSFLWSRLDLLFPWVMLFGTLAFGAIGFLDDYLKVSKKNSKGLSIVGKLRLQFVTAFLIVGVLVNMGDLDTHVMFPFFKDIHPDLTPWFFIPFGAFVIVGAANAVNFTDGLDGLAIGPVLVSALTFVILSYLAGHLTLSQYLNVAYVAGAGEVAVFCAAMVGAGLGFLWFNTYPAQVFMGDVGSLALGAALGMVALTCKQELLLVIVGGVFVLEAVSVIIQIFTFRTTGKRFFRMAPLHHHFELKGWAEPKIIVRFWIISIILALAALSTLKLR